MIFVRKIREQLAKLGEILSVSKIIIENDRLISSVQDMEYLILTFIGSHVFGSCSIGAPAPVHMSECNGAETRAQNQSIIELADGFVHKIIEESVVLIMYRRVSCKIDNDELPDGENDLEEYN